jgi:hypothetical protein
MQMRDQHGVNLPWWRNKQLCVPMNQAADSGPQQRIRQEPRAVQFDQYGRVSEEVNVGHGNSTDPRPRTPSA